MIILPQVITAGGDAELVFELSNKKQERLENIVPGVATVSLRKMVTDRFNHELTHLPLLLDTVTATVTLELSEAQTQLLAPPIDTAPAQIVTEVVGDVRLVQGTDTTYFGPFMFGVRLPETYAGQPLPILTLNVMGGLSADNVPESAELTIVQVGYNIPIPAYTDRYVLIWRLATEPDLISVVFTSDIRSKNLISGFTLWPDMVTLADGREGKVLVSNQELTHVADTLKLA